MDLKNLENGIIPWQRPVLASPDYAAAERIIHASGAKINHRLGKEACYYYPPLDYIVYPFKEQFVNGKGGINAYYYSLFHELAHFTEPRLQWDAVERDKTCELRAEMVASYLTAKLNIPPIPLSINATHRNYLPHWLRLMRKYPYLIEKISDDANKAVEFLK